MNTKIGFKQRAHNEIVKATPQGEAGAKNDIAPVNLDQMYTQAVIIAFEKFLQSDKSENHIDYSLNIFSENVKAATKLYKRDLRLRPESNIY